MSSSWPASRWLHLHGRWCTIALLICWHRTGNTEKSCPRAAKRWHHHQRVHRGTFLFQEMEGCLSPSALLSSTFLSGFYGTWGVQSSSGSQGLGRLSVCAVGAVFPSAGAPRLSVRQELAESTGRNLCATGKEIQASLRHFYLASPCWRRGFYLLAQYRQEILFQTSSCPWLCKTCQILFLTLSPSSVPLKDFKRNFPYCKRNQTWSFFTSPAFEALISDMWLAPGCRLSQQFKETLLITWF